MSASLRILRAMSTKLPRPTNWRISSSDAPHPLMASSSPSHPIPSRSSSVRRARPRDSTPYEHARHRLTLKKTFPQGWSPPRKLTRDAMDGLRMLHNHSPETFTTPVLAERFKISPEAVRRVLKSKWVPDKERKEKLKMRDEARKSERRRKWVQKEWAEGVDKGMLKYKDRRGDSGEELELT